MNTIELAKKIRKDCLIYTNKYRAGHIGSMLSVADILAVLVTRMNIDIGQPMSDERDKFVLSKGHAIVGVLSALKNIGAKIDIDSNYKFCGKVLKGSERFAKYPFVDFYSASLGHGIGVAVGLAMAEKMKNEPRNVFVIVGNGECNEGTIWESMLVASHHKLDNLTIIVDNNKMQAMGNSDDILKMGSLFDKFTAFGGSVIEIDGHDHSQIARALTQKVKGAPKVIIANTIKGKGVHFIENNAYYHYGFVEDGLLEDAIKEVER